MAFIPKDWSINRSMKKISYVGDTNKGVVSITAKELYEYMDQMDMMDDPKEEIKKYARRKLR